MSMVSSTVAQLHQMLGDGADLVIVYDGQCPFCSSYIRLLRLRETVGTVRLLDARSDNVAATVKQILDVDLNEGMMVLYGGHAYSGADALHMLSSLTSRSDAWNSAMVRLFDNPVLARMLYPLLKAGRRTALALLGRQPIRP